MKLSTTCVPAVQGYPQSCPHGCLPQSRFPGNVGARGAPPIVVSSTLALSFAALSIGGVWAIALDGAPSTPLMFCPAVPFQTGSRNRFCSTPGSSLPWLVLWWRTCRAPSAGGSFHTGASLQRSRPVPRPVVLHVPPLLSWRCRSGLCRSRSLLSGNRGVLFWFTLKF